MNQPFLGQSFFILEALDRIEKLLGAELMNTKEWAEKKSIIRALLAEARKFEEEKR